jgi:mannose-1-phosphate guanylyltransferase
MYAVILAGGGGTRLWPLSRPERPKPFLPLLGDESLLQRTVRRIEPLVGRGDVYCVVDRRFGHFVREQCPDVRLIVEPSGKNTAAAITLATAVIDRPEDEVMLVLPADHAIEREDVFTDVLRVATEDLAKGSFGIDEPLVTLGVQPDHASTEYGYLVPDTLHGARIGGIDAYPLLAFEEKPVEGRARELFNMPGVAWNAGMFAWRRRTIRAALEKYTPLMILIEPAIASEIALSAGYDRITPISIDHAVMESAAADHHVVMGGMDVGWSDLGSWSALLAALDRSNGATHSAMAGRVVQSGETVAVEPDDLLVRPVDGRLAVQAPAGGTIVADAVLAHLVGARRLESEIQALLDRVANQEDRA